MSLEEMRAKHRALQENQEIILDNMQVIADESTRVADVAHNSREIIDELDLEFERQTGLNALDVSFLFFATALQLARIIIINKITEIENAGESELEDTLKKIQDKILGKFDNGEQESAHKLFAPLNQIISIPGVPYDATEYQSLKYELFKGANHRFATLGHDPILGLIFGTANILTNTITCVDEALLGYGRKGNVPRSIPVGVPIITTNHVHYTEKTHDKIIRVDGQKAKVSELLFSKPQIGEYCSTIYMVKAAAARVDGDGKSVAAAVIKQIIHIGTDLFTPCGIQLPAANLVLNNSTVEELTSKFGMGDIVKAANSAAIASLINLIIGTLHGLTFDATKYESKDIYAVKTKKILMISNTIATSSNLIWVGANVIAGDKTQIKNLDIGGLLVTMHRLTSDREFIRKVKEEYILGHFNKLIEGEELQLREVNPVG